MFRNTGKEYPFISLRLSNPFVRVADPDPYPNWIRIQSCQWIRIRIQNPDPDPGSGIKNKGKLTCCP